MIASPFVLGREIEYFSSGVRVTDLLGNKAQSASYFSVMLAAFRSQQEVFKCFHFRIVSALIVNCHCRDGNLGDESTRRVNTDGGGINSNLVRRELAAFS